MLHVARVGAGQEAALELEAAVPVAAGEARAHVNGVPLGRDRRSRGRAGRTVCVQQDAVGQIGAQLRAELGPRLSGTSPASPS